MRPATTRRSATDSMKNFIQRRTMGFGGAGNFCRSGGEVLIKCPAGRRPAGVASEIMRRLRRHGVYAGRRIARSRGVGDKRASPKRRLVRVPSCGSAAARSRFCPRRIHAPDITNRPLHVWLDLGGRTRSGGRVQRQHGRRECGRLCETFQSFESGGIQQVIYQMGTKMLARSKKCRSAPRSEQPRGTRSPRKATCSASTRARPPCGCLGLGLKR